MASQVLPYFAIFVFSRQAATYMLMHRSISAEGVIPHVASSGKCTEFICNSPTSTEPLEFLWTAVGFPFDSYQAIALST